MKSNISASYRPGVGIVLTNKDGNIFLGKRAPRGEKTFVEAWQMPQGGIDPGETPEEAALRELAEETGILSVKLVSEAREWLHYDFPTDLAQNLWGGKYRGQKQKWFLYRFSGKSNEVNLNNQTPPEFINFQWVSFSQAIQLVVPFKKAMYKLIYQEFRQKLLY